jgi:pimeloyl-ACP methyl ester carboxylesterase
MNDATSLVDVGGHKTRLLDTGAGEPVVVLHGWGGRIESMTPVVNCLVRARRVVALDLPGFGESEVPRGAWGTPDYAAYVRDALTGIGVTSACFVGHSFGAKISLYLAATQPSCVTKLVAAGSPGLRSAPTLKARLRRGASRSARIAGKLGPAGRALRDTVYERIASQDYKEAGPLRPILVKVVNEDLSGILVRITAPTLLIWGTRDDAAPLAHARRMEELIPDAGLVLFEGAGHFAYLDEPERFCRIVRHFFDVPVTP